MATTFIHPRRSSLSSNWAEWLGCDRHCPTAGHRLVKPSSPCPAVLAAQGHGTTPLLTWTGPAAPRHTATTIQKLERGKNLQVALSPPPPTCTKHLSHSQGAGIRTGAACLILGRALHQPGILQRGKQQLSKAPSLNLQETVLSTSLAANPGCLVLILVQILTAWVGGKLPELLPHLLKWAEIQS